MAKSILVGFVALGTVAVAQLWMDAADLRAHGVRATGRVAAVTSGSRHRSPQALLVLPGGQELTIDVGFPGVTPMVGDTMKVTYDPADPTILDEGWGVDYVWPALATLLEIAAILLVLRWGYSRITRRPFVPDRLAAWAERAFRRSPVFPPPAPPRFVPGAVRKRKPSRRRR